MILKNEYFNEYRSTCRLIKQIKIDNMTFKKNKQLKIFQIW